MLHTSTSANTPITILVIDDEPSNLVVLQEVLAIAGYVPLIAENGRDGCQLAREKGVDLILLDIMMPEEDGFEVIQKLKRDPQTVSIPVIFLTGSNNVEHKLLGFRLGAVDYIVKPFQSEEVIARINLHLKLARATDLLVSCQTEKIRQISEAQCQLLVSPDLVPAGKFSIYYRSFQEAGGDYYDVLELSEHIHSYFIADISGHDIATGFLTSALKALLTQNVSLIYSPAESMKMMHNVLKGILPPEKYLTACLATLNRETNKLTVVSAGHPPLLHIPREGEAKYLTCRGDAMGILPDVFFETQQLTVSSGDKLLLFSDGLLEASSGKNPWPSQLPRLLAIAKDLHEMPLHEIPESLKTILAPEETRISDDIVIMAIEV